MPSIRLHPEHGLNPTIAQCFWCGESKNEIVLLGSLYNERAPMRAVLDYDPCDKCAAKFAQGIALFEATPRDLRNIPPSKRKQLPPVEFTGRVLVVTEDSIKRLLVDDTLARVLKERKAYVEPEAFAQLMPEEEGKSHER